VPEVKKNYGELDKVRIRKRKVSHNRANSMVSLKVVKPIPALPEKAPTISQAKFVSPSTYLLQGKSGMVLNSGDPSFSKKLLDLKSKVKNAV